MAFEIGLLLSAQFADLATRSTVSTIKSKSSKSSGWSVSGGIDTFNFFSKSEINLKIERESTNPEETSRWPGLMGRPAISVAAAAAAVRIASESGNTRILQLNSS
jgi:hypothetical protein